MEMSMTQAAPVLFGNGTISMLGAKVSEMGCKRALIVTDEGVKGAGILDKAIASLKASSVDYVCYDEVISDPPDSLIDSAALFAVKEAVDCVIGLGGGSCLDTAKAVSIIIKNNVPILSLVNKPPVYHTPCAPDVPLILIPTTSGTGSEVTLVSVLSDTQTGQKTGVLLTMINLALVDPELTIGVPSNVTAMTGMDVIAHAVEALTGAQRNPLSDIRARSALERAAKYLPIAVKDGGNIEARYNMSIASTFAGMAFNDSMVNLGHGIAHAYGAALHMPHGILCALATPPTIECFASAVPDIIAEIGRIFGAEIPDDASSHEIGKMTADRIRALMKEIGIESLSKLGYSRDDIMSKVDNVMTEMMIYASPLEMTRELVEIAVASMYDDYV